eukprot:5740875-Amphidinium_carterae.1
MIHSSTSLTNQTPRFSKLAQFPTIQEQHRAVHVVYDDKAASMQTCENAQGNGCKDPPCKQLAVGVQTSRMPAMDKDSSLNLKHRSSVTEPSTKILNLNYFNTPVFGRPQCLCTLPTRLTGPMETHLSLLVSRQSLHAEMRTPILP